MTAQPQILALATAVPPHRLDQTDVARLARRVFADRSVEIERMLPVFENAGIHARYSCVPIEWYEAPSDWKDRNALYLDNALDLIERAAVDCLAKAKLQPSEVDALVTVSTTGLATPSLDARLMQRIGFRSDTERLPIFGLGCAGGVLGLARAGAIARARPGARVLLLVVELCGLTFRPQDLAKSNIVATALFGDGAAAVVLKTESESKANGARVPSIRAWGEHTWPDSLDVMGWRIEDDGFGVLFSRDIPTILRRQLGDAMDRFLAKQGLQRADIDGFICHPGGTKVVEALEEILDLPEGAMIEARAVLRDYGNMSAASVLFVLDKKLEQGLAGRHLMTAVGPGFSAGFCLLESHG